MKFFENEARQEKNAGIYKVYALLRGRKLLEQILPRNSLARFAQNK